MNLPATFTDYIRKENLFSHTDRLLLAVSGGIDSVVLCYLCKKAGFEFSIAHCNFNLRSSESDGDELFVSALATSLGVPIYVKKFETNEYADSKKLSIQVAARQLRYQWFEELAENTESKYILTAHHSDDNIETMLMNFFKGTGMKGLKAMLPKNGRIVRPLLFCSKEEIRDYASEYGISYREDGSNISDKYTRNYFRNELIPGIEKVFPQVRENLKENIKRFREIFEVYQASVLGNKKNLIERKGNEVFIPVLKLIKTAGYKTILFEIISDFHFTSSQLKDVVHLLRGESGKYISSPTHRILRNRKWLIISPAVVTDTSVFVVNDLNGQLTFPAGLIRFDTKSNAASISQDPNAIQLDASFISLPLLVRKWKQGDYFYPLGMKRKKKISRFLIDQKRSIFEKEQTWIIESDKRIIWVIGQRIDDRFKITDQSRPAVNIHFLPSK